jgi:biofilm PGA synthesis lipoprotein PgaB
MPFLQRPAALRRLLRLCAIGLSFMLTVVCCARFNGPVAQQADPPIVAADAVSFRVLCYHDVRDNIEGKALPRAWIDATTIDTRDLVRHFSWLAENGYRPVSLQQIIDAREGRASLPPKAVLLTFDDGYKSVYTKVFPLLKQFKFPALVSVVGQWLDQPAGTQVPYGDMKMPRDQFVEWKDLRDMVDSGLVEVASHSYDMHRGLPGNPQGNVIPAAITLQYDSEHHAYESSEARRQRVLNDLKRSADQLALHLGKRPRALAWPFGAYNMQDIALAQDAGMRVTMNLDAGPNTDRVPLSQVRRTLMSRGDSVGELNSIMKQPSTRDGIQSTRQRVVHVDLDYIYDKDPKETEANLSQLLDRVVMLGATTVYLQAFADPDGNGAAEALYFPNRHLPMRADLFSRVAWQLRTRAGVKVYAWMPVMAFQLPNTNPVASHTVGIDSNAPPAARKDRYPRLSPFDPAARKVITEIYEDLGIHAVFAGILFHDDATLSDYEDASAPALQTYHDQWGLPADISEIRSNPAYESKWTAEKTAYLNKFTMELAATLRQYQPTILTARNIYAQPIVDPASEAWYAQSLRSFLATYDYTAIMAMPYMENAKDPDAWLASLLDRVRAQPGALNKTVFELQSRDWRNGLAIPTETLSGQMRQLHLAGARNFGFYPYDFIRDQPEARELRSHFSVQAHTGSERP